MFDIDKISISSKSFIDSEMTDFYKLSKIKTDMDNMNLSDDKHICLKSLFDAKIQNSIITIDKGIYNKIVNKYQFIEKGETYIDYNKAIKMIGAVKQQSAKKSGGSRLSRGNLERYDSKKLLFDTNDITGIGGKTFDERSQLAADPY